MAAKYEYKLYLYVPSLAAAVVAITVFALLTMGHTWRLFRTRTWFCIPFVVGGLFETVGYVGRALGHGDNKARTPYIIQSLLILVAPALFAASIYMTLGRLMRAINAEKHSIIPVNWLTRFFVIGDVLSFFVQGGGGGIMASGDASKINLGQKIILAGLFLQIVWFGLFLISAIVFHLRIHKYPTPQSYNPEIQWTKMLWALYAVSCLIMLRNIFRVAEYIGGRDGYLLANEWPIYVFDFTLMAPMMAIYGWWYPTLIRPKTPSSVESLESQHAGQTVDLSSRNQIEKYEQSV